MLRCVTYYFMLRYITCYVCMLYNMLCLCFLLRYITCYLMLCLCYVSVTLYHMLCCYVI